jgi:hypothetical protein
MAGLEPARESIPQPFQVFKATGLIGEVVNTVFVPTEEWVNGKQVDQRFILHFSAPLAHNNAKLSC